MSRTSIFQETTLPLTTGATGVRDGEWVCGATKETEGCMLRVFRSEHSTGDAADWVRLPSREMLYSADPLAMRNWLGAMDKPATFPEELAERATETHAPYLSDAVGGQELWVEVEALNAHFQQLLPEETRAQLTQRWMALDEETRAARRVPLRELFDAIPARPGSNARRHSLIFRPELWRVCPPPRAHTAALTYCLAQHRFLSEEEAAATESAADTAWLFARVETSDPDVLDKTEVAVRLRDIGRPGLAVGAEWSEATIAELAACADGSPAEVRAVLTLLADGRLFTAGVLKSLLQKCIRYGADFTRLSPAERVSTDVLVACVVVALMRHGGSFVPDLQRFVSGAESACKRLGMCIVEDSSHPRMAEWMCSLFLAALAARDRFVPSLDFALRAARVAVETRRATARCASRAKAGRQYAPLQVAPALQPHARWLNLAFRTLRSFPGDLELVRAFSVNALYLEETPAASRPAEMPLYHCLDQHCVPTVVHFLDLGALERPPADLREAMALIWQRGTSLNFRLHDNVLPHPVVARAQRCFLHLQLPALGWLAPCDWFEAAAAAGRAQPARVSRAIEPATLAGLVPAQVTERVYTTFVNPHDLSGTRTLQHTGRGKEEAVASREAEQRCHASFVQSYRKRPYPLPDHIGGEEEGEHQVKKLMRTEHGFSVLSSSGSLVAWEDFCTQETAVLEMEATTAWNGREDALLSESVDALCAFAAARRPASAHVLVAAQWRALLEVFLASLSDAALSRVHMYLCTVQRCLEPYPVSRSGDGTAQTVSIDDLAYMRFLLFAASIVPGALRMRPAGLHLQFVVASHAVWQAVRAQVAQAVVHRQQTRAADGPAPGALAARPTWAELAERQLRQLGAPAASLEDPRFEPAMLDQFHRVPKASQTALVAHVVERARAGERGTIFWSPVGTGKTYAVLSALMGLAALRLLPRFVVYTLPPGAMESITNEVRMFGLPVRAIDATESGAKKGNHRLLPYCVNLVKHDHLRKLRDHIHHHAREVFMVVDEMHLLMSSNTQRTSSGLELCKSVRSFLGMTGTMIRDHYATGVDAWVSQIVPFEVKRDNIFAALASAVSNRDEYGIEERHTHIDVPMLPEEARAYRALVGPAFGGVGAETKLRPAFDVCFQVVERGLFDETMRVLATEEVVFLVVQHQAASDRLAARFQQAGVSAFQVHGGHTINLDAQTPVSPAFAGVRVVIATMQHVTGYNLTRAKTLVTGVYFSNQCTRTQMVGRLLRMGQPSKHVDVRVLHCGLLSHTLRHYQSAKSLEDAVNQLAAMVTKQPTPPTPSHSSAQL